MSSHNNRFTPFSIWFILLGSLFLILLFGLRQQPDAESLQESFVLSAPNGKNIQGRIPFSFSDFDISPSEVVAVSWELDIVEPYDVPAILIERPIHHVRIFWDNIPISSHDHAKVGHGRMMVLNTIPKDKYTMGTHLLTIEVKGENQEAGILEQIWIGDYNTFISYIQRRVAASTFLSAVLLFATLFNLIRFLIRPKQSHLLSYGIFFFSLLLVTISGVDMWYVFFSSLDWQLRTKIISIILSIASSSLILGHMTILPTHISRYVFLGLSGLVFIPLIPLSPFSLLQNLRYGMYWLSIPYMVFALFWIIYSIIKKNTQSIPFLGFGSLLIIGGFLDFLAIFGYIQLPPSVPVFSALFAIGVTIYLSMEEARFADRYEQMSRNAQDPILVVSTQGIIIEANPAAEELLNLHSQTNFYTRCSSRDALFGHLNNNTHERVELSILHNQEEILFESVRVSLDYETKLLVLRDITKRKSMEQKLLKGAKLETIGLISSGIAHNFNNMLTAVMGHLSLLRPHVPALEKHRIDTLDHLVMNTSSSIHRILTLVRGGVETRYPQSVNSIVQQALELAQGMIPNSISIQTSFCTTNPKASLSATELHQVIINLLVNAKDAMNKKGTIWINTKQEETSIAIGIEDSGTGVAPSIQEQIFEPFFTTKKNYGTGIGLSVCKRVIEDHAGIISLVSPKHGPGARFVIRLPLVNNTASEISTSNRDKQVLLVEDEWFILEMMTEILSNAGWTVSFARNAQEAREKWKPHFFRLLITDVIMPNESGIDLAHSLQKEDPDIAVLIVSGYIPEHEDELKPQWRRLHKPFQRKQLLQIVNTIITPIS